MPEISVITVTHGRRELLKQKIASLSQQTLLSERFEWLVCVNGDSDGTRTFLEAQAVPFQLSLITFATQQAAGVARNACVKRARGKFLYFSDDDCLLAKEVLEAHLEAHLSAKPQDCVFIGGICFEAETTTIWQPQRVSYWNLNGANSSLSRAAFEAVGGFDEALQGYGGEDLLLGYLLSQQGLSFRPLSALVRHLGADPMRGLAPEKAHSAGRNAARIIRRYPQLAFRLGVHPLSLLLKRLALAFPIGYLWKTINAGSYTYERAYLEGALEEKRHGK